MVPLARGAGAEETSTPERSKASLAPSPRPPPPAPRFRRRPASRPRLFAVVRVVIAPRDDGHLGRDGAERRQRLAAEPERRGPPVEVDERAQLRGVVL